jgi:hypothetical protein
MVVLDLGQGRSERSAITHRCPPQPELLKYHLALSRNLRNRIRDREGWRTSSPNCRERRSPWYQARDRGPELDPYLRGKAGKTLFERGGSRIPLAPSYGVPGGGAGECMRRGRWAGVSVVAPPGVGWGSVVQNGGGPGGRDGCRSIKGGRGGRVGEAGVGGGDNGR